LQQFRICIRNSRARYLAADLDTNKWTPKTVRWAGEGEFQLAPGDRMGFKAGTGVAHQLVNRSGESVTYLDIGNRSPNEETEYPNDDIKAELSPDGSWIFMHKDGTPY